MEEDKLKHIKMFLYDEIRKYEAIKEPLTGAELGKLELAIIFNRLPYMWYQRKYEKES